MLVGPDQRIYPICVLLWKTSLYFTIGYCWNFYSLAQLWLNTELGFIVLKSLLRPIQRKICNSKMQTCMDHMFDTHYGPLNEIVNLLHINYSSRACKEHKEQGLLPGFHSLAFVSSFFFVYLLILNRQLNFQRTVSFVLL